MNFSQPVPMSFILETVAVIVAVIALGVVMVIQAKRKKERV